MVFSRTGSYKLSTYIQEDPLSSALLFHLISHSGGMSYLENTTSTELGS